MIRFVQHKDIDPIRWDETIRNAMFSTVFCTYEMLDILTGDATWHALIMDDYKYVMPLPERSKLGIRYVYSPFFVSQLGIFSDKEVSTSVVSDFFNLIPSEEKHIDLLLNSSNDHTLIEPYTTSLISHQLDLSADYDTLYHNYAQNTQRNIKSSYKHDLTLSHNQIEVADIIALFRGNRGKQKEVHFKERDYEILTKSAALLKNLNLLEIEGVHAKDGTLIAGALFVRDNNRYLFWFSGRDNQYAEAKPMFFLLDEFIRSHSCQPVLLDFNGSMNENVARLYKGFGGKPYNIRMINYTRQKRWQLILKLYRLIKG